MKLHLVILLFLWGSGCNGHSVNSRPLSSDNERPHSQVPEIDNHQAAPPRAVTPDSADDNFQPDAAINQPVEKLEKTTPVIQADSSQSTKVVIEGERNHEMDMASELDIHDHQTWDEILKKFVSSSGEVDYAGIKASRTKLDQYLKELADNPVKDSWSRSQKLAYWINAYNAFTVVLIVNNYPVKSIRDIDRPWAKKFIRLGEENYSLNKIEHDIIRPKFNEPRIHFAVVCAAVSCPRLLNQAYLPETLDQQLDAQTRSFINHEQMNQISEKSIKVSQLFNWYGRDFQRQGTIIDFLNKYTEVNIADNAKMGFLQYDWSLNEARNP